MERAVEDLGAGRLTSRVRPVQGPAEVQHLAAAFDTMAARIESLVDGQRTFLGDVSHQLRTPLAAMRLRLELLLQDVDEAEGVEVIGILAEVARLSRMVDGLLAVARAEQASARPSPVDAASVVEDRVVTWLPIAAQDGVELGCEVGQDLTVLATPGHLEQILDNLICNALKATPRGGHVGVNGVRLSAAMVRISVVDDGPGMSREQRAHAFHRYHSAFKENDDPNGSAIARVDRGGSGLGLTIVHRLVTADRGRVLLDEAPSGGLRAAVELPSAVGADEEAAAMPAEPAPRTPVPQEVASRQAVRSTETGPVAGAGSRPAR
jgi:signal transduction histidine kinase